MKKIIFIFIFPFLLQASPQGVPIESTYICGATQSQFLAQDLNRGYLLFQNQSGSNSCSFKAGSPIVSSEGLQVLAGQNYETIEAYTKSAWYCKCAGGNSTIEILTTEY